MMNYTVNDIMDIMNNTIAYENYKAICYDTGNMNYESYYFIGYNKEGQAMYKDDYGYTVVISKEDESYIRAYAIINITNPDIEDDAIELALGEYLYKQFRDIAYKEDPIVIDYKEYSEIYNGINLYTLVDDNGGHITYKDEEGNEYTLDSIDERNIDNFIRRGMRYDEHYYEYYTTYQAIADVLYEQFTYTYEEGYEIEEIDVADYDEDYED